MFTSCSFKESKHCSCILIFAFCVALQARLLEAMKSVENQLSPSEKKRNAHGPCLLYDYTPDMLEPCTSTLPGVFQDIINNHAR